ncbi:MAG: penicillin-binding protein activator LpoB [Lentisphaerae bacterium]|nr:penicillin-binding protein activator LpoB [Lentisphaerota bacterium]
MVNIMKVVVIAAIAAAFSSGCSTSMVATETQLDRKAMTAALEPQDVRRTVEKMVDSMLADQEFIAEIGGKRPVLDITGIKNRSSMHLDMRSITSSIRTKLLRSRRFRFMDRSTAADDLQIMNDQALNGMTDQSKAVKMGRQSAAQMYLYGELSEMRQHVDGVTDRYYKFTLNLKDIGSGEIVWSDEQEIRKQQETSFFGM